MLSQTRHLKKSLSVLSPCVGVASLLRYPVFQSVLCFVDGDFGS